MLVISEPSTSSNLFAIVTPKIMDNRSHNKYTNNEKVGNCENYQNVTQRHEMSKCDWKDGCNRLAQHRVVTNNS